MLELRQVSSGYGDIEIVKGLSLKLDRGSITTIIGFLALNFSQTPPFWHFGNMTAFGILMAFIYSVTLLPALLQIIPIKVRKLKQNHTYFIDRFANFIIRNYKSAFTLSMNSSHLLVPFLRSQYCISSCSWILG